MPGGKRKTQNETAPSGERISMHGLKEFERENEIKAKPRQRIPSWLRRPLASKRSFFATSSLLEDLRLNTVCRAAKCPNRHECYTSGTATFLILGENCTRNCRFCNIHPGPVSAPDPDEPQRVAQASATLKLKHIVITSVTRDDLPDGGAGHFAKTVLAVREAVPESGIEVLIPDFKGNEDALLTVFQAGPDVINHNVETHPSLYAEVRPQAEYAQSLELLSRAHAVGRLAKSGLMVGLGESDEDVHEVIRDLHQAGCSIITIGQYMPPTTEHQPLDRYVTPEQFQAYADYGKKLGVKHVFSAPLVRSSYQAGAFFEREAECG